MSASWITFAFEVANFLLLAALLGWLFFRPVRAALERRRSELENERCAALAAREQAERERSEAQAQRAEQQTGLDALRDRLRHEAEAEKQDLLERGRAQMQRERERVEQELLALRRAQARASARDAACAAHEIVRRLLAELNGPELEELLVSAACRELEALRASGGPLAPLVIESARPLAPETGRRLLAAAGNGAGDASVRVDPELIAGLRVLSARGLVDASVAGISGQTEQLLVQHVAGEPPGHE